MLSFFWRLDTAEPLYNGHFRTDFSGRCKEVAVMGRFSVKGFDSMDQKSGQENMAVEDRCIIWFSFLIT